MNDRTGQPTVHNALDLRLKRGPGWDAVMGPVAIDADDVARHVNNHRWDPGRRTEWLEQLKPHWDSLPLPKGPRSALNKLQDPSCQIILAGQQPALCAGPLLSTVKLLSASGLAADLEERGIPAVALFWIADEDHDVGELNPGSFRNGSQLGVPFDRGRRPISGLCHPLSTEERIRELEDCFEGAPHSAEVLSLMSKALDPSPSAEFCNLLWQFLPEEAWLPIHPQWLRRLQLPWIQKAHSESALYQQEVRRASKEQVEQGIPAPVRSRDGAPFFVIDTAGERVRPESSEEMDLFADPERLSADALLRGVIQDAILEPAAVILGATEWCYTLQTRFIRKRWEITQPLWLPRPGLRPLESDLIEALTELGVGLDRLVPGVDLSLQIPNDKGALKREELSQASSELFEKLQSLATDPFSNPALRKKAERLRSRWQKQLESLGRSVDLGLDLEVEAKRNRARAWVDRAFPGGMEPERSRNLCDLLAWQGLGALQEMITLISGNITRWDGRVSPWPLSSSSEKSESESPNESS